MFFRQELRLSRLINSGKKITTFCFGKIFELSQKEEFIGNFFVSQLSLIPLLQSL